MKEPSHPIQPLLQDEDGTVYFKENSVVTYLWIYSRLKIADITKQGFSQEDKEQFAQLIGFNIDRFSELDCASQEVIHAANRMFIDGDDERDARINDLTGRQTELKEGLVEVVRLLFGVDLEVDS